MSFSAFLVFFTVYEGVSHSGPRGACTLRIAPRPAGGDGALSYEEFVKDVIGVEPAAGRGEGPRVPQREGGMSAVKEQLSAVMKKRLCLTKKEKSRAFNLFDRDRGGTCSFAEFRDGVKGLGIPVTNAQVRKLWKQFKLNPDDTISFEAFFDMVLEESFADKRRQEAFKTIPAAPKGAPTETTTKGTPLPGLDTHAVTGAGATRMVMGRPALRHRTE